MGALVLASDSWALSRDGNGAPTATALSRAAKGGALLVAAGYGLLAANLQLSAALYSNGVQYWQILVALSFTWAGSWWLLDRTKQGAILAIVCAIGAPAAELVLMSALHTWHYSRPDLFGSFVSFVPCCYGGYVPLLAAFTRYLATTGSSSSSSS